MHDNPQPASGLDFVLSSHRVVALTGRDAAAFAQAQFMNDVGALVPGHWQWSGWLTPKGRVVALFALLKLDEETVWLVLPDADPATFLPALRRFVFRTRIAIDLREDLHVTGRFDAPAEARGNVLARGAADEIELDFSGALQPRVLRIAPSDTSPVDDAQAARWTRTDLEHGLPRLSVSQVEQWTPQQLSLERLNAFSVKKGCYPGQEIVARTHFLGKAKRGLVLLEASSAVAAGLDVHGDGAALGTIVCASDTTALAVLPLERVHSVLETDGVAMLERPFLEGLDR